MSKDSQKKQTDKFDELASKGRTSLPVELWLYLKHNKKWWLIPILIALLVLGLLVVLAGTSIAPFLYPLF